MGAEYREDYDDKEFGKSANLAPEMSQVEAS